jgi:hypothetical protein
MSGIANPIPPFVGHMITGERSWALAQRVDGDVMPLMNVDRPGPMSAEMNAYLQSSGALFVAGLRRGVSVAVSMYPDSPGMQIEPIPIQAGRLRVVPIWRVTSSVQRQPLLPVDCLGESQAITQGCRMAPAWNAACVRAAEPKHGRLVSKAVRSRSVAVRAPW